MDDGIWRDRTGNRLPARGGVGFKPKHAVDVLEPDNGRGENVGHEAGVAWFEVHPETYMVDGGPRLRLLDALAERHPVSLHGVALSLAGAERPDPIHLAKLKGLVERIDPAQVSEHLAWSDHGGVYAADLLPVPLTRSCLESTRRNIDITQQALGRRILIENPSHYIELPHGGSRQPGRTEPELTEIDFLVDLARSTGCGLLIDVNNVFVSHCNVRRLPTGSAEAYLDAIPAELIGEIHLAGHATDRTDEDVLLIDDHGSAVADPVWRLYERLIARVGPRPSLVEWDNDVPEWPVLRGEARKADTVLERHRTGEARSISGSTAHFEVAE